MQFKAMDIWVNYLNWVGSFWDIPTLLFSHNLVIWGHGLKGKEAKKVSNFWCSSYQHPAGDEARQTNQGETKF